MTSKKNAAQVAAQAEPCPNLMDEPLDLHGLYQSQAAAGYVNDLRLSSHEVQTITARLRGVSAITGLLIAASDRDTLRLSEWMQTGLIEAVHALADDAHYVLENRNSLTEEAQEQRREKGVACGV